MKKKKIEIKIGWTEAEVSKETGYSMQTLYFMRVGQTLGKYKYKPILTPVIHWFKLGVTVVYTEEGRRVVIERAVTRGKIEVVD